MNRLTLLPIPKEHYADYRYEAIFRGYKWDPQVEDHNTVAKYALLIDRKTAIQLGELAEKLAAETVKIEENLLLRQDLTKKLGFPRAVNKAIGGINNYDPNGHVRLMRFDFHPTTDGWAISEVNSDVPGGLAEASVLPSIAQQYLTCCEPCQNVADHLLEAFKKWTKVGKRIAFVHATSYSDDRQVMQFLGDYFEQGGFRTIYAAPDHITWKENQAFCLMEGEEGAIDGIVRFFPLEWLINLPRKSPWQGYYHTLTPSCNHPIAMLAQSKRLPLIWDELGVDLPAWKSLLPETCAPAGRHMDKDWIYKPALGRVGESISIKEAITAKEYAKIRRAVHWQPRNWIAQKQFESKPVFAPEGEAYHLCVGVFTVDGKAAGFYGRISPYPRIDARAKDIPLLVEKEV